MDKFYNSTLLLCSLTFCTGAAATFAIPPFSLFPLIFILGWGIYLISLLSSRIKTFVASWFLGFGWFSFGLYWIGSAFIVVDTYHVSLMPIMMLLLPSILAFFWASAFVIAKSFTKKKNSSLLLIIVFLSLVEYLRANLFTGFPWLMPSMVLTSNDNFIQIFSFVGSFSSNTIVLTLCILPFITFHNFKSHKIIFLLLFTPIFIIFCFGFVRLHNKDISTINNTLITLVQPNIKQKDKWILEKKHQHLKKLEELSNKNLGKFKYKKRLIIWPETSFTGIIPNEMKLLSTISMKILDSPNNFLIVGLLSVEQKKLFNSLVFLNNNGKIINKYDKIHLVPFGEYIPFRKHFGTIANLFNKKDFSEGTFTSNFNLEGFGEVITLICYEILFSDEVLARVSKDTSLLINITNDAWFGKTIGPYHHLSLAKIRSVELGLSQVRVANTGISAYISPYGEEITRIPIYEEGAKTVQLISPIENTLYRNFGDYLFIISILFLMFINKLISIKSRW